jgi:hypothetical protein
MHCDVTKKKMKIIRQQFPGASNGASQEQHTQADVAKEFVTLWHWTTTPLVWSPNADGLQTLTQRCNILSFLPHHDSSRRLMAYSWHM